MTGRPYWLVRRRTQALFAAGVIHATVMVDQVATGTEVRGHLAIRLTGERSDGLRSLCDVPGVAIVARGRGGPLVATGAKLRARVCAQARRRSLVAERAPATGGPPFGLHLPCDSQCGEHDRR